MGGYGSGRHSDRETHESAYDLPVRYFRKRRHRLDGGSSYSYQWSTRDGEAGSVGYRPNQEGVYFWWKSTRAGESSWHNETVFYTWTSPNFGGKRAWWECPRCGRRCGVVYVQARGLMCRVCARLRYSSEGECDFERAARRRVKIDKRLGVQWPEYGIFGGGTPLKPKGMHWRTYLRLVEARRWANMEASHMWTCRAVERFAGYALKQRERFEDMTDEDLASVGLTRQDARSWGSQWGV